MRKLVLLPGFIFLLNSAHSQNVGIGTTLPKARLHVADSAVVFTGATSLPATAGLPPVTGAGTRMMWYPNKAAFRAGRVSSTQWNETSVGLYSAAFGLNTTASGDYAASFGNVNTVSGDGSFTSGQNNSVSATNAAAIGERLSVQSYGSFAIGRYNIISGSTASWVNTDPLFVIGNGFTFVDPDGFLQTTRRNAFSVDKLGNTAIAGGAGIDGNLRVGGITAFEADLFLDGSATLHGKVTIDDTLKVAKAIGINLTGSPKTSLDIDGALTLRPYYTSVNYTGATIPITVGDRSYIGIAGDTPTPVIRLSDGLIQGQVLTLTCTNFGSFKLVDSPVTSNVNLSSDRTLSQDDILVLVFNGSWWVEVSFTNN